jgi:hypothetical protein
LDFVNPADYPTLRFSNLGVASGYESFQVSTAATTNSGTPLYVTSIPYNFNYHQPISYPNGNVYEGFGSNARPALLGIGFPNMYMQHVYNTTAGPTKNVLINNTLIATASSAANIGSLSHYISAMSKTQVGDDPEGRYIGYIKELFIYKSIQTSGVRDVLTSNINNFYQIGNFPDYTSGFLADYSGAAVAYSVRKLSNTAIKALRVRRTVAPFDEQDIGFTAGGDLDEAAIVAFGGSDPLAVSRWYDQSGFSRHAVQDTPGSQPRIYNGTAVITENGKPIISRFNNNSGFLPIAADMSGSTISMTSVTKGTTSAPLMVWFGSNLNQRLFTSQSGNSLTDGGSAGLNVVSAELFFDGISQGTGVTRGESYTQFYNNQTLATWVGLNGLTATTINLNQNAGFWQTHDMQEVIFWESNQEDDRPAIEENINDYYAVIINPDAATSGFLFDYPNAAAAYSVRQLNNNAEYCMRVERSGNPNDTLNVGFDANGDLDTAAITSFGGSDVLRVSHWYDQSGNQAHMVQDNPIQQPMIYDGASIIRDNNKPCIEFLGASNLELRTVSAAPSVSQPTTYFVTANKPNHSSYLWDGVSSRQAQGDQSWIFAGTLAYNFYPNSALGSQVLFTALFNGASSVGRINATQTATGNPGSNALSGIKIISKEGNKYQEFVVYGADQTSQFTPIESNINTYYSIY